MDMRRLTFIAVVIFVLVNPAKSQVSLTYPQINRGLYDVGTSNLTHDNEKITAMVNAGSHVGEYWEGRLNSDKYITQLLPDSTTAIRFQVTVPQDSTLYGSRAGDTIPYVAIVCYPTSETNLREDYILPGGYSLPKMQKIGEAPIFAEPDKKYDLVIYSHGLGGHISNMVPELCAFASMGRIVASLYFADSRFVPFSPSNYNEAQQFALRPLAVSKLIDYLLEHSDYKDHINPAKIAAFGSSYGGATNLALLGGEMIDFQGTNPYDFSQYSTRKTTIDERIVCAAGIVPWFGENSSPFWGIQNAGVSGISRPFMALCGQFDEGNDFEFIRDAVAIMQGDKYLIRFNGMGHNLGEGAGEDCFSWINLFFDAYLNEDSEAADQLLWAGSFQEGADDVFVPFTVPRLPVILIPENNARPDTNCLEFHWQPANDVSHFKLEIASDETFANLVFSDDDLTGLSVIFENFDANVQYFWRIKAVNEFGESEWTESRHFQYSQTKIETSESLPDRFTLKQNYPNPFNPATTIEFHLPKASFVVLEVFNIRGEKIQTLASSDRQAGIHKIQFDGSALNSGIYFYRLKSDNHQKVRRALLLK
jgi:hypothetical protein